MSKLISLIRRAPKRFTAATLMIAAAIIVPAAVFAWGPDRPTFTVEHPATYNTFNSITNNPDYGDERNFVRIKDAADTGPGNWKDEITVDANKEYLVQMYVHNNAADNLNLVAENTRVMANVPNTTGKQIQIDGFVTSSNANPNKIWDQAIFKSSQDFNLTYVPGSAILYNNVFKQTGAKLSDGIVTSAGALVGYDKLDGKIPGCFKYSGYVSFKVKAQVGGVINFTTEKLVSKKGENKWVDDYKAQPGETVDYLLEYKNIGTVKQDNVILRDALPANMTYVNGSTVLGNANAPSGVKVSDNVTKDGINAGSYLPGGNAWIIFSAKVADKEALPCGSTKLVNKVHTTTGGYFKEDTANVTVDKECQPEVKYACKSLGITQVDRTNFKFATAYTAENATFKSVTYVIKNAAGATVDTKTSTSTTLDYTQATVGKYTVQATVTFTVDGQDKTATSDACKGAFEVKEEESKIKVCELATKKIIIIDEKDFDANKYSKDLSKCAEETTLKVCDLTTKQIVTINEKDFDETKYSTDLSKCETPVTPPELPQTGAGESIVAIVGLGALIASAAYYIASRRALNQ